MKNNNNKQMQPAQAAVNAKEEEILNFLVKF